MFYFSFSFSFYFFKSVDIELQHLGLMIDEMFKCLWKWNSQKTSKELVIFGSMTISHDVLILKGGYLGIPFAKKKAVITAWNIWTTKDRLLVWAKFLEGNKPIPMMAAHKPSKMSCETI